jgi:hypothetical protein
MNSCELNCQEQCLSTDAGCLGPCQHHCIGHYYPSLPLGTGFRSSASMGGRSSQGYPQPGIINMHGASEITSSQQCSTNCNAAAEACEADCGGSYSCGEACNQTWENCIDQCQDANSSTAVASSSNSGISWQWGLVVIAIVVILAIWWFLKKGTI